MDDNSDPLFQNETLNEVTPKKSHRIRDAGKMFRELSSLFGSLNDDISMTQLLATGISTRTTQPVQQSRKPLSIVKSTQKQPSKRVHPKIRHHRIIHQDNLRVESQARVTSNLKQNKHISSEQTDRDQFSSLPQIREFPPTLLVAKLTFIKLSFYNHTNITLQLFPLIYTISLQRTSFWIQ